MYIYTEGEATWKRTSIVATGAIATGIVAGKARLAFNSRRGQRLGA